MGPLVDLVYEPTLRRVPAPEVDAVRAGAAIGDCHHPFGNINSNDS
jgi:hypothetical protein